MCKIVFFLHFSFSNFFAVYSSFVLWFFFSSKKIFFIAFCVDSMFVFVFIVHRLVACALRAALIKKSNKKKSNIQQQAPKEKKNPVSWAETQSTQISDCFMLKMPFFNTRKKNKTNYIQEKWIAYAQFLVVFFVIFLQLLNVCVFLLIRFSHVFAKILFYKSRCG